MKYEEEWNYARLSEFTFSQFSYSHNLSRIRIESRSIHVFDRDKHLGPRVADNFLFISVDIILIAQKFRTMRRNINLSPFSSLIECKLERANTQLFSRANIWRCEQFSRIPEHFFVLFSFSPHLPARKSRANFPQFISVANGSRKRVSRSNTLTSSSRWRDADPLVWPTKLQYRERGGKRSRGIDSLFSARIFAKKEITDTEIIDCGLETISISRDRY